MDINLDKIIYAGYSINKQGELKFRTATCQARVSQLEAQGEQVNMIKIDPVETKGEAARTLLGIDHAQGNVAVEQLYIKKTPGAKLNKREVIVKVPTRFAAELTGAQVTAEPAYQVGTAQERKEANKRLLAQYEAQMAE